MFERNKVDNLAIQNLAAQPIELALIDGETIAGRLLYTPGRSLNEHLNGANSFIEVEPYGGERQLIAKSAIRSLKLLSPTNVAPLPTRTTDGDGFDPYRVLSVTTADTWDDVRAAYHRLSKAYHPDRYASAELPKEVIDYLTGMARRINLAYAALQTRHLAARSTPKAPIYQPSQPIYESRPAERVQG